MTVGLRQGCVMSPWLLNLFMDGVVRERKGKDHECGVCLNQKDGRQCKVSSLWFADSEECLQRNVNEMGVVCGIIIMKVKLI